MRINSNEPIVPVKVAMRRLTSLDTPTSRSIPTPLLSRRANIEEAELLTALLGRAYEDEVWETESTRRELFQDDTIKAVLLVAADDQLMATASLQILPDVPGIAQVRWVATEKDWQRKGLASALVIGLLQLAKTEGCQEVRLQTSTDLVGAIALYLKLGFEPFVRSDEERDGWKRISKPLGGLTIPS